MEERRGRRLYEVRFPSPVRSGFGANDTVWGRFYVPGGADRPESKALPPCVLLLPVMAAPNLWIETCFAGELVRRGFSVFIIELPYQFHRRPNALIPSGQVFLARTPERLAFNFRQAVLDSRRAISWLERSGRVDPKRISVLGISLGALVGSVVLSLDGRLKGGVFVLGGADFPSLLTRSSMTGATLSRLGLSSRELSRAFRGLDPIEFADRNRDKRVLLLNVRSDTVIPLENARALRRAFPSARQVWLPLGHYSAMLHLLWIPSYVAKRLQALESGADFP